ncbi:TIGR04255 family protein [Pseudohongiella nitratireducens]|uniref:TIGR04255 family protein n=1 Tax=Pseudohongiella nitratireducens TaxID=1768907 RepID=UPI0030EBFB8F
MSGQFIKAPLVYVTAKIRTTEIPALLADQRAALHQAMMKCGLPEPQSSEFEAFELSFGQRDTNSEESSSISSVGKNKVVRRGFFDAERTQALILEPNAIEYRASAYTKYDDFIGAFSRLVGQLIEGVDVLSELLCQEFVLSYADAIVPYPGRELTAYFANDGKILPLDSFFENTQKLDLDDGENEIRLGQVQITRVKERSQKIDLTLEQLPITSGVKRLLPTALLEPESKFTMPLTFNGPDENPAANEYCLLMTQAAKLEKLKLGELKVADKFESLHALTKETFWHLINRDVCDVDWEYVE